MLKSSKLGDRFIKKKNDEKAETVLDELSVSSVNNCEPVDNEIIEADLQTALLNKIDSTPVWFEYTDLKQRELIRNFVDNQLNVHKLEVSEQQREYLTKKLHDAVSGFGQIDYLLSRENVSAVYVNGIKNVHIEINGKVLNTEISLSQNQINLIVNNIFKLCKEKFDTSKPIWNLKYENYSITIIIPPISGEGINLTICKLNTPDIKTFFEKNITSKEIFDFILSSVAENKNIVISGDINTGKTFFLNVLINALKNDKRSAVLEKYPQISANSDNLMKFLIPDDECQKDLLISNILKISPEYIFADLNKPLCEISEKKGCISTLRAPSIEAALTKLISTFITDQSLPEKIAKARVLTDFDYIVQINKIHDGSLKVTSVVELKPARSSALSVKTIAKLVDGQYITEIPQPLTSIRAEAVISQAGSMYSRFSRAN